MEGEEVEASGCCGADVTARVGDDEERLVEA